MKYCFLLILIFVDSICHTSQSEETGLNNKDINALNPKDVFESNYDTTNGTINLIINCSIKKGLLNCESDSNYNKFILKNENDSIFFLKDGKWNFILHFLYSTMKECNFQNDIRYNNIYFMPIKKFVINRYSDRKSFYALIIGIKNSEYEYLLIIDKFFKIYAIAFGDYNIKDDKFGVFQYKGSLDTIAYGTYIGKGHY